MIWIIFYILGFFITGIIIFRKEYREGGACNEHALESIRWQAVVMGLAWPFVMLFYMSVGLGYIIQKLSFVSKPIAHIKTPENLELLKKICGGTHT